MHLTLGETGLATLPCSLALLGVVVTALERRNRAMLALAGIAAGLAPFGMLMLPFALGVAIQRRSSLDLLILPIAAIAAHLLVGPYPNVPVASGLWTLAIDDPRPFALLTAIAIGAAAWFTAEMASRPLPDTMILRAALFAAIGFVALAPASAEAMAVTMLLAILSRDRRLSVLLILTVLSATIGGRIPAALASIGALMLVGRPLLRGAANDNPCRARIPFALSTNM